MRELVDKGVSSKNLPDEADEGGSAETFVTSQVSEKELVATGIRVGTLVKTKSMTPFVSRTRPDGLHVIDMGKTLARIETAARAISRLDVKRVVVHSTREYGKTPVEKFCELTGTIPIIGRFMPGTFTNPLFPQHIDPELLIVIDPAMDFQAVDEAGKIGIPVFAVCDTDNVSSNVDLVIPANNRGRKALAAVFWLLARFVLIHTGAIKADQSLKYVIEDFETKLIEEEVVEA
ncbi:MAG: 30S ribosomal protein S2 [Thaumarchaeota archaeon]|nr:30S ribosomal protein S2 [Nitrososphaerota archaeon]